MKGLNVILHSLATEPEAWSVDKYWAKHASGLTIWIGNGFFSYHIEKPFYKEFGLFERIKLYQAIKKTMAQNMR
ncbi:MAG: hypothetical protein HQM14_00610 [SAR324 cluster bacterium]|nr:hypothetical protein [SAR324 cluster bacterium]